MGQNRPLLVSNLQCTEELIQNANKRRRCLIAYLLLPTQNDYYALYDG